jgi:hypothetical protein
MTTSLLITHVGAAASKPTATGILRLEVNAQHCIIAPFWQMRGTLRKSRSVSQ